jgi:hypothetical protein
VDLGKKEARAARTEFDEKFDEKRKGARAQNETARAIETG